MYNYKVLETEGNARETRSCVKTRARTASIFTQFRVSRIPIFHLATLFARCEAKTRIQQHYWSKLVSEKGRREQVGIVPTFFSVRPNKFAKWKTSLSVYKLDKSTEKCRHGGGVCIFIKNNLNFRNREDLPKVNLEFLAIEVCKPHSRPSLVVTWYKPPNSPLSIFSSFQGVIDMIDAENLESYLLGDVNCDLLAESLGNSNKELLSISTIYATFLK